MGESPLPTEIFSFQDFIFELILGEKLPFLKPSIYFTPLAALLLG